MLNHALEKSPHQWDPEIKKVNHQPTSAEILTGIARQLASRGVGFTNHTVFFAELANLTKPTYPPYDILSVEENIYEIRMALAGIKKTDLDITFQNQLLTIKTKKNEVEEEDTKPYFHKGIATRAFTVSFPLAEYVEVVSAEMSDGILTIRLERDLPEAMKPRSIKIK